MYTQSRAGVHITWGRDVKRKQPGSLDAIGMRDMPGIIGKVNDRGTISE